MIRERKLTSDAMGGKTARACDSCLRKRARWFCVPDDAFLCQACDTSVHSANQLASRHERVRLEISSSSKINTGSINIDHHQDSVPSWHQGFTRKARTPRHNSNKAALVPDEEGSMIDAESEDQLMCRVPVFDPFASELCDIMASEVNETVMGNSEERNTSLDDGCGQDATCGLLGDLPEFLHSDVDLAEFAADIEKLLEDGINEDSPDRKDMGLLDCKQYHVVPEKAMKVKNELVVESIFTESSQFGQAFDIIKEPLNWDFDYESPITGDEKEAVPETLESRNSECKKMKNISLRLNYEAVITAWSSQGSPWTNGSRPTLNEDGCWADCLNTCPKDGHLQLYGGLRGHMRGEDGDREARVQRYKEKRRTRLFSKKIRYEVRKLNAEKRPRMKGRFVKRTSFVCFP
ncbi:hypothetical protein K2173_013155 [Erythroxylum novogranatense]|uniref:Uncharacterized protein n=1 Tax=Erythroxylum novogranatense TaxID=1862640 RepID=A0AAV8S4F4_9ROSI|nr:hypothetical protein K2173_013155 [Erythroxylum novogranatense]